MQAAKLERSDRLQRVAKLLRKTRRPLSTMEIIQGANVCAVSAIISELRENGMKIDCRRQGAVWHYRMVR